MSACSIYTVKICLSIPGGKCYLCSQTVTAQLIIYFRLYWVNGDGGSVVQSIGFDRRRRTVHNFNIPSQSKAYDIAILQVQIKSSTFKFDSLENTESLERLA